MGPGVVLVHINFHNPRYDEELDEFVQLVKSSGARPLTIINGQRDMPDAGYFIGRGKVAEIAESVAEHKPEAVLFNHELSPSQERNLERKFSCRVLDRVGLILDIFAQRARSYEGKLQVELAQLQHLSTRLVRGWTHLERQKGGIGLRGPGETQLETDRRLLGKRIKTINSRLDKVRSRRQQGRKWRKRAEVPLVALVGYTNAGKSTLFNKLTGAGVYTADKLFATLDPTLRRVGLSAGTNIILSDTVGFIRHIPYELIRAFHATLEEVRMADLLLHLVDISDDRYRDHIEQVNSVIASIGAGAVPQIMVYNKIDAFRDLPARAGKDSNGNFRVWLSAQSGEGVDLLKQAVSHSVSALSADYELRIPAHAGKLRARLFEQGEVCGETGDESGGWVMQIRIEPPVLEQICQDSDTDLSRLQ